MRARTGRLVCTAIVAIALVLAAAPAALAHEARNVGAYHFLVGWGQEPAFAGQMNSVQLILSTQGGKPVASLGNSLRVTVMYGSQRLPLALTPTFDPDTGLGTPGDYRAWFVPTAPGNYTFVFTGTIGHQRIDQSFTSSPTTFATVEDPASLEFPAHAPSTVELSQRLDATIPRMATSSSMSTTEMLAIAALVLGLIGVGGMIVVLVRLRR